MIYYTLVNTVDHIVDQTLTFTFSYPQPPNDILSTWLNVSEYNRKCCSFYYTFSKSDGYLKKNFIAKSPFLRKNTFFAWVSRLINFNFFHMLLLWKDPLRLVNNVEYTPKLLRTSRSEKNWKTVVGGNPSPPPRILPQHSTRYVWADLFEQVLDQRYFPEVSEKIFTHDISMIRR